MSSEHSPVRQSQGRGEKCGSSLSTQSRVSGCCGNAGLGTAGPTALPLGGGGTFSYRLSGDSRERPRLPRPERPAQNIPEPPLSAAPSPSSAGRRWNPCRRGTQLTADRQWYFPSAWVSGAGLIQRCFSISLTPHCPPLIAEMLMSCLAWKWFLHLRWEGFALIGGRGRGGGAHLSEFSREFTPCPPSAGRRGRHGGGGLPDTVPGLSLSPWLSPWLSPCQSPSQLKCWGGWRVLGVLPCPPPQPRAVGVLETCFPSAELQVGRGLPALPPLKLLQAPPKPVFGRSLVSINDETKA